MSHRKVVEYPEPVLSKVAEEVAEITGDDRALAKSMIETMFVYRGVGIAAPQVGASKRMIIVCPSGERGDERIYFNPKITVIGEGEEHGMEGCLSLPGLSGEVKRGLRCRVEALDIEGKRICFDAEGFEARVFQHEIDHLNGKLFIDRLGFSERQRLLSDLKKLKDRNRC